MFILSTPRGALQDGSIICGTQQLIDAKIKGEGVAAEKEVAPRTGNFVDLMAALTRSLGESTKVPPSRDLAPAPVAKAPRGAKAPNPDDLRRQSVFKLPIEGGQKQKSARSSVEVVKAKPEQKPPARDARLEEQQNPRRR